MDSPSIKLFRFSSRAEAERSGGQLEMWMKDAAVSDDDVDEINLKFGPEPWQTWLLVCGGTAVLLAALQPCLEEASFDAHSKTFLLTRRNGVGLRTVDIVHPLESIARAAVSERVVAATRSADNRSASSQKSQRLSVLLRSWAVGSYGETAVIMYSK